MTAIKPVFAVDIDGVLANWGEAFFEVCAHVLENNGNYSSNVRERNHNIVFAAQLWDNRYLQPRHWDWPCHLLPSTTLRRAWQKAEDDQILAQLDPYVEWVTVMKDLAKDYSLVFVTSRRTSPTRNECTRQWLEAQGFDHPQIIYTAERMKGLACASIDAMAFIDDNYVNCVDVLRQCGTRCKVMVKDWMYNRHAGYSQESPYIKRVITFEDMYEMLGIDVGRIPEEVREYGRDAKRQWESRNAPNTSGGAGGGEPSVQRRRTEVRDEQLASGNGVDEVLQRSGETSWEVAGARGLSAGFASASLGTRNSQSDYVVAVPNVWGRTGRQTTTDSQQGVLPSPPPISFRDALNRVSSIWRTSYTEDLRRAMAGDARRALEDAVATGNMMMREK